MRQIIRIRIDLESTDDIHFARQACFFDGGGVAFRIILPTRTPPWPISARIGTCPEEQADPFQIAFLTEMSKCSFGLLVQFVRTIRMGFLVFLEDPQA